ncbi:hypothetical protein [Pseudoxanthomonas kaohsiungensis]|uniref:Uncharacterized protein n=1 Tax=Pseudoxanthomonas kaohsiungensis TaxID=283923 RepID=A0ABW3LVG9_9GAMM|nr:hypothetical protein [Pseudoxanthomonas kaohsiungensis]
MASIIALRGATSGVAMRFGVHGGIGMPGLLVCDGMKPPGMAFTIGAMTCTLAEVAVPKGYGPSGTWMCHGPS